VKATLVSWFVPPFGEIVRRLGRGWDLGTPSHPGSPSVPIEYVHKEILERDYTTDPKPPNAKIRAFAEAIGDDPDDYLDLHSPHLGDVNGLFAWDPYWVVLRLVLDDVGLQIGSFEVQAQAPSRWSNIKDQSRPIIGTENVLRRLPLHQMVRDLRAVMVQHVQSLEDVPPDWANVLHNPEFGMTSGGVSPETVEEAHQATARAKQREREGQTPVLDREFFEVVAKVYREADRAPTLAVADHFDVSYHRAAKWVFKCRHDFDPPLLPPTRRGKATQHEEA
jgi:hypothetical protein